MDASQRGPGFLLNSTAVLPKGRTYSRHHIHDPTQRHALDRRLAPARAGQEMTYSSPFIAGCIGLLLLQDQIERRSRLAVAEEDALWGPGDAVGVAGVNLPSA